MGTVQYRVEPNPLTKPASYKLRFMPKQTAGYDELAAAVAKDTGLSAEQAKAFLQSTVKNIKEMLCNGMQVTLEEALTFAPSLGARLNNPNDPLPPIEEVLRISVSATRPLVQYVQQNVTLERVSTEEKAPSILSAADTTLELNNVLNPAGVLRLTGSNLAFDKSSPDCGCVIAGTWQCGHSLFIVGGSVLGGYWRRPEMITSGMALMASIIPVRKDSGCQQRQNLRQK